MYWPEMEIREEPLKITSPALSANKTIGFPTLPKARNEIVWLFQIPFFSTMVSPADQLPELMAEAVVTTVRQAKPEVKKNKKNNIVINVFLSILIILGVINDFWELFFKLSEMLSAKI